MTNNIVLYEQGDSVAIPQSGMELSEFTPGETKIRAILEWNAAVDLDIHAFYRPKNGKQDGHVFFQSKGNKKKSPYIHLDKDMGVGNVGGDNKEVITIGALADVDVILIATNIFRFLGFLSNDDNFGKYDGKIRLITSSSNEVDVPLTSKNPGKWCVIALIDNSDPYSPIVTNINEVTDSEPKIDDYLDNDVLELTYDD
ncbi:MAG: TerD family protein [Lentimicrobiaceae bacterium]|nr:TerD family protein [Lentimicrobiaceae bacterium]